LCESRCWRKKGLIRKLDEEEYEGSEKETRGEKRQRRRLMRRIKIRRIREKETKQKSSSWNH
jgi:hypothetical protein